MKTGGGIVLTGIGLFMFLGFIQADLKTGFFATTAAFIIAVIIPLAGGLYLLDSKRREAKRIEVRKLSLANTTLRSEILKLALAKGGKLTTVEVVSEFAITQEAAKKQLGVLVSEGQAEVEITESGIIVYSFYDLLNLKDKSNAKGVLDA